ncbi:DUF4238 domain-containing protein (plasmid) [Arsenophonus sp. aPb]|uniref:DUF4238 domain-containing protein n=1 Tax=Arsenophonus sp. aPb TaxID=3041619 RepID=UPI0024693ECB|nr:DUF4238 domain-containing protein [Arsenophonus sp. aPb]WGL99931.1 DUF4238 domain-containing protein [Arsenophonus sp. aPb]
MNSEMRIPNKKIRHHYVWAYYLRRWSSDKVNIWYISRTGKISNDGIKGLAREDNFYKIGFFKEKDVHLVKEIIKNCHVELQKQHVNFFKKFAEIQNLAKIASDITDNKDINDRITSNIFEDYFSSMEKRAIDLINSLNDGKTDYIENKDKYCELCLFVAYQYSRTLRMKRILIDALNTIEDTPHKALLRDFYQRNWWFMCSFFAGNLSYDMATNKSAKIFILNNETDIDFITSDQPVININPDGHKAENIDYYYPLSPKKALLIITSDNNYFNIKKLTKENVCFLNREIALQSYKTIFSINKDGINNNRDYCKVQIVDNLP